MKKWHLRRAWLFLRIVWRESPGGGLMSVATAWDIADTIHNPSKPYPLAEDR